jgi:hypothetical protein
MVDRNRTRRHYLFAAGTALSLGLAGCQGESDDEESESGDDEETETENGETAAGTSDDGTETTGADVATTTVGEASGIGGVIDDFERAAPLESYRNPSESDWFLDGSNAVSGDFALTTEGDGYYNLYSLPGDGLPAYPRRGDSFRGVFSVDGDNGGLLFGLDPEAPPESVRGYHLRVSPFDGSVAIQYRSPENNETLTERAAPVQRRQTFTTEVNWRQDGRIVAHVTNDAGMDVEVTATDERREGGGFGYRVGDNPATVSGWFDDFRLV